MARIMLDELEYGYQRALPVILSSWNTADPGKYPPPDSYDPGRASQGITCRDGVNHCGLPGEQES